MKERLTQVLLLIVAVLLVLPYFRGGNSAPFAQVRANDGVTELVRAKMIELVDEHGVTRSTLKTESEGTVVFRLMDGAGTIRVKIGANVDGSSMVLLNEETEPGIHLLSQRSATSATLAVEGKEKLVLQP